MKNMKMLDSQYTLKLEEYQDELIEEVNSIFKK